MHARKISRVRIDVSAGGRVANTRGDKYNVRICVGGGGLIESFVIHSERAVQGQVMSPLWPRNVIVHQKGTRTFLPHCQSLPSGPDKTVDGPTGRVRACLFV